MVQYLFKYSIGFEIVFIHHNIFFLDKEGINADPQKDILH